jgi:hypothetical protein
MENALDRSPDGARLSVVVSRPAQTIKLLLGPTTMTRASKKSAQRSASVLYT